RRLAILDPTRIRLSLDVLRARGLLRDGARRENAGQRGEEDDRTTRRETEVHGAEVLGEEEGREVGDQATRCRVRRWLGSRIEVEGDVGGRAVDEDDLLRRDAAARHARFETKAAGGKDLRGRIGTEGECGSEVR